MRFMGTRGGPHGCPCVKIFSHGSTISRAVSCIDHAVSLNGKIIRMVQ